MLKVDYRPYTKMGGYSRLRLITVNRRVSLNPAREYNRAARSSVHINHAFSSPDCFILSKHLNRIDAPIPFPLSEDLTPNGPKRSRLCWQNPRHTPSFIAVKIWISGFLFCMHACILLRRIRCQSPESSRAAAPSAELYACCRTLQ